MLACITFSLQPGGASAAIGELPQVSRNRILPLRQLSSCRKADSQRPSKASETCGWMLITGSSSRSSAAGEAFDLAAGIEMHVEPLLAIIHRHHVPGPDPAQHPGAAAAHRLGAQPLGRLAT